MAAWFYYDLSNGETQWNHPLDEIYKQKVIEARENANAKILIQEKDNKHVTNSETDQIVEISKDTEVPSDVKENCSDNDENKDNDDKDEDVNDISEYKILNVRKPLHLDVDENTEQLSVATTDILEQSDKMMPLAPLGPISKGKPLPALKKLAPLGSADKNPLGPIEQKPLSGIGRKLSTEKEKPQTLEIQKQNDPLTSVSEKNLSPKKNLKGLKLGMGKTFLKSESLESLEHRDSSEQNSVRSTSSQKGILKSHNKETLLRQEIMQRDEKRIMFNLGANIEFASEVTQ